MFVETLKRTPKDLTRANYIRTVESISNLDIGLGYKISFSKTKHQALDAVCFTTIRNGKYITLNDWKEIP